MKITLLCSDPLHPVCSYLEDWMRVANSLWAIELVHEVEQAAGGDILFLVSCSAIISKSVRSRYGASLVLHASDLPVGKGWSPHIWELSQGAESITLSLLEAEEKVDSGRIWKKLNIQVPKDALWNEINHMLFQAELKLIEFAIKNYQLVEPQPQTSEVSTVIYPRRTEANSRIDPFKSIAEQFDLIRVCDPVRFPAFFDYLGNRYLFKVEKSNE
jgi:methionyl-tRNA formyltransferase